MYRKRGILIINSVCKLKDIDTLSDKEDLNVYYRRSLPTHLSEIDNYQLIALFLDRKVNAQIMLNSEILRKFRRFMILVDTLDQDLVNYACSLDPDQIMPDSVSSKFMAQKIEELINTPCSFKQGVMSRSSIRLNTINNELSIKGHKVEVTNIEKIIIQQIISSTDLRKDHELISTLNDHGYTIKKGYLLVIIHRLRKKIKSVSGLELIYCRRGVGYYFSL